MALEKASLNGKRTKHYGETVNPLLVGIELGFVFDCMHVFCFSVAINPAFLYSIKRLPASAPGGTIELL
jgi:hypothetical protein